MKRSIFLTISAAFGVLFGAGMIFMPGMVSETFALSSTSVVSDFLLRCMGSMLLSMGVANYFVRNAENSAGLKAVLVMNVTYHFISIGVDIAGPLSGAFPWLNSIPSHAMHLFIGVGSAIYLSGMKN